MRLLPLLTACVTSLLNRVHAPHSHHATPWCSLTPLPLSSPPTVSEPPPPQENLVALLSEPRFGRCLTSLRLLVRHQLPLLVKQLDGWRSSTHSALSRMPEKTERERMLVFSKRVRVCEGVCVRAAVRVEVPFREVRGEVAQAGSDGVVNPLHKVWSSVRPAC